MCCEPVDNATAELVRILLSGNRLHSGVFTSRLANRLPLLMKQHGFLITEVAFKLDAFALDFILAQERAERRGRLLTDAGAVLTDMRIRRNRLRLSVEGHEGDLGTVAAWIADPGRCQDSGVTKSSTRQAASGRNA